MNTNRIALSKTAPWNSALTNGYRDRFAQVGERRFKVYAESLEAGWYIEEVDHDGEPLVKSFDTSRPRDEWFEFGFMASAMTLAEARRIIAEECNDNHRARRP